MPKITLVSGSEHKLKEWRRIVPSEYDFDNVVVELEEIQSSDLEEIVTDKAKRAYEKVQKPVVVEDVSASLEHLNGMPGPFIKFFEQALGDDALFQLAKQSGERALITDLIAYYDGKQTIIARGEVAGIVVPMRINSGWGFDCCFVPDGSDKTYSEMTLAEKDAISHRSKAIKALLHSLK